MQIVGKFVDVAVFRSHVESLQFGSWRPSFIVVHNTWSPTLANYAEWRAHPEKHGQWTPEQWGRNLASFYANEQGWNAGPHAFVCPDGVLLFTPFTQKGTHAPSWNSISLGIETVGNFDREPFDNGVRKNLIAVLGILHASLGLDPTTMRFHKEDPRTSHKDCPGHNVNKPQLIADVESYMHLASPSGHVDVPPAVHIADTAAMTAEEMTSVRWLQIGLNKLAFGALVADGIQGPRTRNAVRAFQKAMGLVVDGKAGPVTRKRLKAEISNTRV